MLATDQKQKGPAETVEKKQLERGRMFVQAERDMVAEGTNKEGMIKRFDWVAILQTLIGHCSRPDSYGLGA